MPDNLFLDALRGLYDARLLLESKVVKDAVSISNWSKQLIGNRAGSFQVNVTADVNSKVYMVSLSNWQPVRDIPGYDLERVATPESGSSDIWAQYRDKVISPDNAPRECLAVIGYLFDQLITGKILSSESGGKAYLLERLMSTLKPKTLELRITAVANTPELLWDLSGLRALLKVCKPRYDAILNLESRPTSRKARTKRRVVAL